MIARLLTRVVCSLVSVVLLGGCAMHVPVSETILFHDGTTQPTHNTDLGFGVAGTVAPTLAPARTAVRQKYPGRERVQEGLLNGRQAGGGFFLASYDEGDRYAFSAMLGFPVAGLDATLKIRGRNYLTLGYSALNQGQVFLLHRTVNSSLFGAAVGVGGRYERYAFGGSYGLAIETEHVASVGTRIFGLFRVEGDPGGGIRLGTYVGYAPELERPVVSLTLTMGEF